MNVFVLESNNCFLCPYCGLGSALSAAVNARHSSHAPLLRLCLQAYLGIIRTCHSQSQS